MNPPPTRRRSVVTRATRIHPKSRFGSMIAFLFPYRPLGRMTWTLLIVLLSRVCPPILLLSQKECLPLLRLWMNRRLFPLPRNDFLPFHCRATTLIMVKILPFTLEICGPTSDDLNQTPATKVRQTKRQIWETRRWNETKKMCRPPRFHQRQAVLGRIVSCRRLGVVGTPMEEELRPPWSRWQPPILKGKIPPKQTFQNL